MAEIQYKNLLTFILILNLFNTIFSDESNPVTSFKCTSDGLFEDENDCQMYYECLWIGTAFEKTEHTKCPDKLIYNPRKHRCDNIFEFETQFANGIQTGEELIEFMRFRNCIGTRNLAIDDVPHGNGYNNNDDPYYSVLASNTSPPTDYWPQLYLFDESPIQPNEDITSVPLENKTTTTTTGKIEIITKSQTTETTKINNLLSTQNESTKRLDDLSLVMEDEKIYFGKKNYLDTQQQTKTMPKTSAASKFLHIFTLPLKKDRHRHKIPFSLEKTLNDLEYAKKRPALVVELDDDTNKLDKLNAHLSNNSDILRNSSVTIAKNNGTYIIFGTESMLSTHKNKSVKFGIKKLNVKKRQKKLNPTFFRRRLLSINEIDTPNSSNSEETDSPTTILDDEEIDSTDLSYHDKEQAIHEFTNKILNDFNQSRQDKLSKSLETTSRAHLIDSIEQRLTKRGEHVTRFVYENDTNKVILHKASLNSTLKNLTQDNDQVTFVFRPISSFNQMTETTTTTTTTPPPNSVTSTTPVIKITVSSRPLKFLKMLPAVNLSVNQERKQLKFDKLNDMFEKKLSKQGDVEFDPSLEMDEINQSSKQRTHRKYTTKTTPYVLVTNSSTTAGVNISKVLSSTLSWTSSFVDSTSSGFLPSKTNSKPFMQTYKINQTKRLPNQFASLRLNYAGQQTHTQQTKQPFISTNMAFDSTTTNPYTKIDELERGGKFQRLRLVPADTLIECKENDFGLECSCSITLSPPKCKQLINSFLSSCRILGCKNNGKCINMAYKYPIPYVCSCPAAYMGSYCEISRANPQSSENDSSPEIRYKQKTLSGSNETMKSFSSAYKLPPTKLTTKVPNNNNNNNKNNNNDVKNTTRSVVLKSSSPTFNLSLATFYRNALPEFPKPRKSYDNGINDNEFKEPLCQPNPCLNDAKCIIVSDKFKCVCSNSSYAGKYCEIYKLKYFPTTRLPLSTPTTSNAPTTSASLSPTTSRSTFTPSSIPRVFNSTTYFSTSTFMQPSSSSKYPDIFYTKLATNPKITTARTYFWQCPSNCFYSLGRGFCTLSQSGFPHCLCHIGWTGIDCSQKNFCVDNNCINNSTCVNYSEMSTYICLCPVGYSGRNCENRLKSPIQPLQPKRMTTTSATNIFLTSTNKNYKSATLVPSDVTAPHHLYRIIGNTDPPTTNPKLQSSILPPKNPCLTEKCKNNGTCVMSFSHAKNRFSFVCKCEVGFYGPLCENSAENITVMAIPLFNENAMPVAKAKQLGKEAFQPKINRRIKQGPKQHDNSNPCNSDIDLCRKHPNGNHSFICVKSFITQDYTLCLPTKSMSCKESNPCLNGGVCVEEENMIGDDKFTKPPWKCICSVEYTGRLCETEICSPIHRLFTNHTMCMPNSNKFDSGGVGSSDIELILDMHNTLRRQVAPIAANMQKMYWDIRLQYLAQKRAQLCSVENTGILMRQQPGYGIVIGENLAAGYEKWSHVLTSWMSERKYFIYKSTSPTDNLQAGHYTQMIYSSASRIGCGFAQCTNTTYDRYFVCYYGEMQTYYSRYEPYQDGKSCSMCENNCDNGLCDCNGAYCLNGGTMDLRTCTCSCPYSTFSGRYCENVICPSQDSPFCSQTLFEDKCWLYPVVRATCPYMCSLCTRYNENVNASVSFNENLRY